MLGKLEALARGIGLKHGPTYKPRISAAGNLIVDIDGVEIATSIPDRDYFKRALDENWFTNSELEVVVRLEELVQGTLKEVGPRIYSGLPAYSHIDRVVETAFGIANDAGVPLDFITLLALVGHDIIEDDEEIRDLLNKWRDALVSGEGYDLTTGITQQLQGKREEKRGQLRRELLSYVSKTRIDSDEKAALERDVEAAVRLIYHLTRFQDARPYALSMGFQYTKIGNENIENTLRRALAKNCDVISNLLESGPLHSREVMRQMAMAFQDETIRSSDGLSYVIGTELKGKFGEVNENATEMPPAVRVLFAFRSLFPLHFLNETLNSYGADIKAGKNGDRAKGLLGLVELSKAKVIDVTLGLLDSAIEIYEKDPYIKGRIGGVDDEINRRRGGVYFYQVTVPGIITEWLAYDAGGKRTVADLGESSVKKFGAYRTARHLREAIPMFSRHYNLGNLDGLERPVLNERGAPYDPNTHRYFTLGKVDKILEFIGGHGFTDAVREAIINIPKPKR